MHLLCKVWIFLVKVKATGTQVRVPKLCIFLSQVILCINAKNYPFTALFSNKFPFNGIGEFFLLQKIIFLLSIF